MYKRKDLGIYSIDEKSLILASDSCGGIGIKKNDILHVEPFYTGALTTRVVLMEVLSTGAKPISISNAVCNEMNDTGKKIWDGVKYELNKARIDDEIIIGSTEENMPTTMTAVGISCVGIIDSDKLLFKEASVDDYIVLYGIPKVGSELNLENDKEIVNYSDLYDLLEFAGAIELSATGSKGILYECNELATLNNLTFVKNSNLDIDLKKSCGVSTCLVVIIKESYINFLPNTDTPVTILGQLR